jgi:GNAT superfamily N-acetyltransferase
LPCSILRHLLKACAEDIVDIQPAHPEQAPLLKQIAIAAKGYWGYPDEWLARWGILLAFPPDYIRTNHVYVAIDNGEVVGFYALIHRGDICLLDHLWVIPERIGTGVGRLLFSHALQQAATLGARRLEWEADPHAVGFYQRMGGRQFREQVSDLEGPLPVMSIDIAPQAAP